MLGTLLFESANFERAERSLDRVRLEGPFSNQALLRAGWADASAENYERALVPWNILVEREPTDGAVQEAMLALPYAYGKLNVHGRAAVLYDKALVSFGEELEKVDASIGSIREGKFLKALVREEIRQDKDWVIRLRTLPDAPETYYLTELMASHDFQTALQNYLDLEDLRRKLSPGRPASMPSTTSFVCGGRTTSRCCRDRCAVPGARLADSPAPRAARPPGPTPAGHADRAEAGATWRPRMSGFVKSAFTRSRRRCRQAIDPQAALSSERIHA